MEKTSCGRNVDDVGGDSSEDSFRFLLTLLNNSYPNVEEWTAGRLCRESILLMWINKVSELPETNGHYRRWRIVFS